MIERINPPDQSALIREREGANYRRIAIQLAVRLACAAPDTARRIAAEYDREVERARGVEPPCAEAFARIGAILREDADWSQGLELAG